MMFEQGLTGSHGVAGKISMVGRTYMSNSRLSAQQACQGSIVIQAGQEQVMQAGHPMLEQLRCAPHNVRPEICSSPVADKTPYQTPPQTSILQWARYQSHRACATMRKRQHHKILATV